MNTKKEFSSTGQPSRRQKRLVALVMKSAQRYDRLILQGVAARVHETEQWSLFFEEDPKLRMPKLTSPIWDGVIADLDDQRTAAMVAGLSIPVVGIGGGYGWYDPSLNQPYFTTDNRGLGRLGAEHLLERGFTNFAYVGLTRNKINGWSNERGEAFVERIEKAGYKSEIFNGSRTAPGRWETLLIELIEWLRSLPKPIGLMACNDIRARHLLESCKMASISVPDEVAVLGVDNDEVMCELANPPLSSIEQSSRRIGYEAAVALEHLFEGKPVALCTRIKPDEIITRRSTDIQAVSNKLVARAVSYLRENADRPIRVSDVLDHLDVSRSTLDKQFRKTIGRTVHNELKRLRIDRAKKLLSKTDLPIREISTRSGFDYLQYFTTVFRRTTGMTPADYRRAMKIGSF
jgi:LacI family transcriptional regulator, galactose operon repressor